MITRRNLISNAAGISVLGAYSFPKMAASQTLKDVSVGLSSTSFISVPLRVATAADFFEKRGLNIKINVMPDASVGMAALISGSLDFMIAGAVNSLLSQLSGHEVVIVSSVYRGYAASIILSKASLDKIGIKPDAPVADRLKALDGLLLASPSRSSNNTLTPIAAAKTVGANIRFTYMEQSAMAAALQTGAIDGYVASAPFWASTVAEGRGSMWMSGSAGDFPYESTPASSSLLETTRDYASKNPDVVQSMKAGLTDFISLLKSNPSEVEGYIGKLYPSLNSTTVNVLMNAERKSWETLSYDRKDLDHDIEYILSGGIKLPNIEKLDRGKVILS